MSGVQHTPMAAKDLQDKALRDGIAELMLACTEKQNAFLHRIHDSAPWKGLANCPPEKLGETYELLRRTVAQNAAAAGSAA